MNDLVSLDRASDLLGTFCARMQVGLRKQDCEFFPTMPGAKIRSPNRAKQNRCNLRQDHIARIMSMGIVHGLEMIEIEQNEGERLTGASGRRDLALPSAEEVRVS